MIQAIRNFKFWIAALFAILFAGVSVVFAMLLMMTVDAATEGNMERMFLHLGLTVVAVFVELFFAIGFRYFTLRYTRQRMENAKNELYGSMLDGIDVNPDDNIAMFSTNTDIVYDKNYQAHVYIVFFVSQFVFSVAAMVYLNWMLFLISFVISMLPALAPVIFKKRISKSIEAYSQASKSYIDFIQDSIKGLYDIKSSFSQKFFKGIHMRLNKATEKTRASNKFASFLLARASNFLGSFSFIAIVGFGGFLVVRGQITVGVLIAAIQLINGMVSPIGEFFTFFGEMKASNDLATDYYRQNQKTEGKTVSALKSAITIDSISFSYPDTSGEVITGFSAKFAKGKSYAIIGESGCGKTTLVKIIAGLLLPEKGKIYFDEQDIRLLNVESYGAKVRYVNQDAHLFNLSVKDNIEMGYASGRYMEKLNNLGLDDIQNVQDKDLISGGQKQRILIARALNVLPDVLILDEPTSSLDKETALSVIKHLHSYKGITLIVITHESDTDVLRMFDEIIKIDR